MPREAIRFKGQSEMIERFLIGYQVSLISDEYLPLVSLTPNCQHHRELVSKKWFLLSHRYSSTLSIRQIGRQMQRKLRPIYGGESGNHCHDYKSDCSMK
jgi:hypothetical protein